MNVSWRDVVDTYKFSGMPHYEKCQDIAKSVGYNLMAFNGMVFSVNDATMTKICDVDKTRKEKDMIITWRDVLDSYKLPGRPYYERSQDIAKSVGYKYVAFNGMVFSVDDATMTKICDVENLENGFYVEM